MFWRRRPVVTIPPLPPGKSSRRPVWREVAHIAGTQKGLVTLAQLQTAGLSASRVYELVAEGRLWRAFTGVFSVGHPVTERDAALLAATLACGPDAFLGFQTGADALGAKEWDDGQIHIVVPRGRNVRVRGIRAHQTTILAPQDRFEVRGLPVLSPARIALDLGDLVARRQIPFRRFERGIHDLQVRWGLDLTQINDVLDRARGRRGAPHLARACLAGFQVTRSALEDAYLRFVRRHSLPEPVMNARMVIDGVEWEFDACYPQQRVAVELDSEGFHGSAWARKRDRRKGNAATLLSWSLLRYDWFDITGDDRRALAEHRRALGL